MKYAHPQWGGPALSVPVKTHMREQAVTFL